MKKFLEIQFLIITHTNIGSVFKTNSATYINFDECDKRKWIYLCSKLSAKKKPNKISHVILQNLHFVPLAVLLIKTQERNKKKHNNNIEVFKSILISFFVAAEFYNKNHIIFRNQFAISFSLV